MALANKCDRCGKLYERTKRNNEYKIKKLLPYSEADIDLPYSEADIDLCSECQEAFEKFMKSGEKKILEKENNHDSRFWKSERV